MTIDFNSVASPSSPAIPLIPGSGTQSDKTDLPVSDQLRLDAAEFNRAALQTGELSAAVNAKNPDNAPTKGVTDSTESYRKMAACYRLLSAEEEIQLAYKIRSGDAHAYKTMANHNLRLVISIANSFRRSGVAAGDLIQEGNIGLLHAIKKFDPDAGFRFSTYATHWIRRAILQYILASDPVIKKPLYMAELINKAKRTDSMMHSQLGRPPSVDELAYELGISAKQLLNLRKYSIKPVSLEQKIGEEESSELKEFISDPNSLQAFDKAVDEIELKKLLRKTLSCLTARERELIARRYGYDGFSPHSIEECGAIMNISQSRARQIETAALKKLRFNAAKLKIQSI